MKIQKLLKYKILNFTLYAFINFCIRLCATLSI